MLLDRAELTARYLLRPKPKLAVSGLSAGEPASRKWTTNCTGPNTADCGWVQKAVTGRHPTDRSITSASVSAVATEAATGQGRNRAGPDTDLYRWDGRLFLPVISLFWPVFVFPSILAPWNRKYIHRLHADGGSEPSRLAGLMDGGLEAQSFPSLSRWSFMVDIRQLYSSEH